MRSSPIILSQSRIYLLAVIWTALNKHWQRQQMWLQQQHVLTGLPAPSVNTVLANTEAAVTGRMNDFAWTDPRRLSRGVSEMDYLREGRQLVQALKWMCAASGWAAVRVQRGASMPSVIINQKRHRGVWSHSTWLESRWSTRIIIKGTNLVSVPSPSCGNRKGKWKRVEAKMEDE